MLQTRSAAAADAALIAEHRHAMFTAMGRFNTSALDVMRRASEPWIAQMMQLDKYLGWIMNDDDRPVASAGLLILDWPPHPLDPTGESRAYLLNIFVAPGYRRRGLAGQLVQLCLDEAHRRSIRVVSLHASDQGRPLYEKLGFKASNEMLFVPGANRE